MLYAKSPITEAIIGLRLANRIEDKELEKLKDELRKDYPFGGAYYEFNYESHSSREGNVSSHTHQALNAYHLRDNTALNQVLVGFQLLSTSRLAPYEGWEALSAKAFDNYQRHRQAVGYRRIDHIGIRFINRLDLPLGGDVDIDLSKYLNISPSGLPIPGSIARYFMSIQVIHPSGCHILIQTGVAPPALIDHMAVMLDIDVAVRDDAVPQNPNEIATLLVHLRAVKNDVFERLITDKARLLFEPKDPS